MTNAGANSRRRRWGKYLLTAAFVVFLLLAGTAWYVTTNSFQAMVRRRLVTELERITGGRVELGSFHTAPFRLRVEVRDLTIHGREGVNEVPYAHVDRAIAQVKIISVLGAEFGFHSLILDQPIIHLIVYPDGTTNQPTPTLKQASGETPVEQLFRLSIGRLEVRRGKILLNQESIPVDFAVNDVSADMVYSLLRRRYESTLLLGKIVTTLQDYRPVAWMAEVHFSLGAHNIEIEALKATSGRSRLAGSGRLVDFRRPHIDGSYDARLDVAEISAVTHFPGLGSGNIELQGRGSWSVEQFSSGGKLLVKDFAWHDKFANLADVNLNAQFSASPQRVVLSQIQARLLGGSAAGEGEIAGWLGSPDGLKNAKGKHSEEQRGKLSLKLKDISAGALANTFSTPELPLKRLNITGASSGAVEARWKNSLRDAEVELALDVTPPASPSSNQLPMSAHARGTYHFASGDLEVAEFSAALRASQIHASGKLASSGALKLSVVTTDLGEWQAISAAFGRKEPIPAVLHGRATFNGTATGKFLSTAIAGNLQAQNFDYLIPATAHTPAQSVHWDILNADIQLSRHTFAAHNGTLQHGDATFKLDLTAALDHGAFTNESSFTARVDIHNVESSEILGLAGYSYPIRGKMNLSLQASGTPAQPEGTGRLQLIEANIYGEAVHQIDSALQFNRGEIQLPDLSVAYYDAKINGNASYGLSTHAFRFALDGRNFDLGRVPARWNGRLKLGGRMDVTAHGSGTREEPAINATLRVSNFIIGQERLGSLTLDAVTRGSELHLNGNSEFEQTKLGIEGNVSLRDDWLSTIDLHFDHFDVDALLRNYLQAPPSAHSVVAGDFHFHGPLLRPQDTNLTASLSSLNVNVESIKLQNDGPIRFAVSSGLLRVEPFHLLGEDSDLSGSGTLNLAGEHALDLRAQGHINLKLIESFAPEVTSSGVATVDMTVSGSVKQPVTQGRVQITNGALAYLDLPSALSDINGTLVFNQERLQVDALTAHTGGGLVTFGGTATWYARQLNFDMTLQERGVRLRYPPGVSSTADADLRFAGNSAASTLSGDVTVNKLSVTPGFDFGAYLARSARATALPPTDPVLNRIRLDVHVVTAPELQMQTAVVRLSGDADLFLRGTAAKPVLLGRAEVLEGQVYFNGTKYELERGEVVFSSPVITTPVLDLQATTHVQDYDITLILNGEPDKLKVTYRSEPPLPEADIIALLALGRTTEESAQLQQSGQASFTQDASSAIINQALNTTVSNRAQHLFGVSRIKIDPEGLSTETNLGRGPLVTIEQQVADNLALTYSTSVEQASQQIIQVVYNLSRNISIVAIRDQNGVISFDVRIRKRKE